MSWFGQGWTRGPQTPSPSLHTALELVPRSREGATEPDRDEPAHPRHPGACTPPCTPGASSSPPPPSASSAGGRSPAPAAAGSNEETTRSGPNRGRSPKPPRLRAAPTAGPPASHVPATRTSRPGRLAGRARGEQARTWGSAAPIADLEAGAGVQGGDRFLQPAPDGATGSVCGSQPTPPGAGLHLVDAAQRGLLRAGHQVGPDPDHVDVAALKGQEPPAPWALCTAGAVGTRREAAPDAGEVCVRVSQALTIPAGSKEAAQVCSCL